MVFCWQFIDLQLYLFWFLAIHFGTSISPPFWLSDDNKDDDEEDDDDKDNDEIPATNTPLLSFRSSGMYTSI